MDFTSLVADVVGTLGAACIHRPTELNEHSEVLAARRADSLTIVENPAESNLLSLLSPTAASTH
jgi:hypothetical protein